METFSKNYDQDQKEYQVGIKLLPNNMYTRRKRKINVNQQPIDVIKAVVVHWTGAIGQTAIETWNYFSKNERDKRFASSHYIVGLEGEVLQAVPDEETSFHAGAYDSSQYTALVTNCFTNERGERMHNDWTIGIETEPAHDNGYFNRKTYTTLARLTADLLIKYRLNTRTGLYRHYDFTGKNCPKMFEGENNELWEAFKSDVEKAMTRKE